MLARCRNDNCAKSTECFRYADKDGELMLFKNICNEHNNYVWFVEADKIVVAKEGEKDV